VSKLPVEVQTLPGTEKPSAEITCTCQAPKLPVAGITWCQNYLNLSLITTRKW